MEKIDFANGQQPAVNDTNLNKMQANIENAINAVLAKITPTVLFEGSATDNFTINDDISNYKKVIIYYTDNNGSRTSRMFGNTDLSNDITVALDSDYNAGEQYNTKVRMFRIAGKNVTKFGHSNFNFVDKSIFYDDNIIINLIEGYKEV